MQAFIDGYRAYLTEVRDRAAAEKKAGRTDRAGDRNRFLAPWPAAFADKARLAGAIRAAYAEAP